MRSAWDRVMAFTSSDVERRAVSNKADAIITSFGLSVIQHSPATQIIQLYHDNPTATNEQVRSVFIFRDPEAKRPLSQEIRNTQLVYLYANLVDYQKIAAVTGLTEQQVGHYLSNLRKLHLIGHYKKGPKLNPIVYAQRAEVMRRTSLGQQPAQIKEDTGYTHAVVANARRVYFEQQEKLMAETGFTTGKEIVNVRDVESLIKRCPSSFGEIKLDTYDHALSVDGKVIPVTAIEENILQLLIGQVGQIVHRIDILRYINNKSKGTNTFETVKRNIAIIRSKLGEYDGLIETVIGKGYRIKQENSNFSQN